MEFFTPSYEDQAELLDAEFAGFPRRISLAQRRRRNQAASDIVWQEEFLASDDSPQARNLLSRCQSAYDRGYRSAFQ